MKMKIIFIVALEEIISIIFQVGAMLYVQIDLSINAPMYSLLSNFLTELRL